MSRSFDQGKSTYAAAHRVRGDQDTRHILANSLLEHYGVKRDNYSAWSHQNYRMGSRDTNIRDRQIDHHITGEVFHDAGRKSGYDAQELARSGVSRQQQLDAVGRRFEVAKAAYEATGEGRYLAIQKDLRGIAAEHLDGDLRQFRLSHK